MYLAKQKQNCRYHLGPEFVLMSSKWLVLTPRAPGFAALGVPYQRTVGLFARTHFENLTNEIPANLFSSCQLGTFVFISIPTYSMYFCCSILKDLFLAVKFAVTVSVWRRAIGIDGGSGHTSECPYSF